MMVKYVPVFVNNIEEGLTFFRDKLGFKVVNKIKLNDDVDCTLIEINTSDQFLGLIENTGETTYKSKVILNTDDCLKDYHSLKMAGVVFEHQPQYLSIGLAADFVDSWGNQFTLLEERNYNEN